MDTTKVGVNKNMIDNEIDGSGDEIEGGTMLMAVEGIVDESRNRVEMVVGAAQAPTQAQAPNNTAHTHAHTHMNTLPHTAGVKRTYAQTVSPNGRETSAMRSGVGLGPGPVGALTLTAQPPTHPTTTSKKTSGKWRDPPKFSDPALTKLHKDLAVLSTKLEKAKYHKELLDDTMNNCERGPVGLRDPTVPQVILIQKSTMAMRKSERL